MEKLKELLLIELTIILIRNMLRVLPLPLMIIENYILEVMLLQEMETTVIMPHV